MTDTPRPHILIANIATAVAAALLLFLFIFPNRQVTRLKESLTPYAEAATQRVIAEDWEGARTLTAALWDAYEPYDMPLRLYLSHEEVDALHTRIRSCANLARAEDDQIIVDLEDVKNKLSYLESIETFSLWNLF